MLFKLIITLPTNTACFRFFPYFLHCLLPWAKSCVTEPKQPVVFFFSFFFLLSSSHFNPPFLSKYLRRKFFGNGLSIKICIFYPSKLHLLYLTGYIIVVVIIIVASYKNNYHSRNTRLKLIIIFNFIINIDEILFLKYSYLHNICGIIGISRAN